MNSKASSHSPSLGALLREKRREKGLSLKEAAKSLGVSFPYISEIERGRRDPSDALIQRIAEVFGIDFGDLRKLDKRVPLEALRSAVFRCPDIGFELRRILSSLDQGKISPQELAKQLARVR